MDRDSHVCGVAELSAAEAHSSGAQNRGDGFEWPECGGLGGLYPAGYPVGTVLSIVSKPGDNFLKIDIDPSAEIDRSRHLLLLYISRDSAADAVE